MKARCSPAGASESAEIELGARSVELAAQAMHRGAREGEPRPPAGEPPRELADRLGHALEPGEIAGQREQLRLDEQERFAAPDVVLGDRLDLLVEALRRQPASPRNAWPSQRPCTTRNMSSLAPASTKRVIDSSARG